MRAVFGLGNPGLEYVFTRHNVGFQVIDLYRKSRQLRMKGRIDCEALVYRTEDLLLVKPMTRMNASGEAVKAVLAKHGVLPADVLVVYDDLDLPFGGMRALQKGGAGTHKGMRSVLSMLEDERIPRLRIGIGIEPRPADTVSYVLGRFTPREWQALFPVLQRAAEAVEVFRTSDIDAVMNVVNRGDSEVAGHRSPGIL